MRYRHVLTAALISAAPPLAAQQASFPGSEIRPFVGVYVPAGALKSQFKPATTIGAQYAYEMHHNLHLLGSLAWSNGSSRLAGLDDDNTSIWQYDVGAEAGLVRKMGVAWLFRPFVGAGAGGRTYDPGASAMNTTDCAAGYASAGTELQRSTLAWRFEARGYLSCYQTPTSERSRAGNDFTFSFGAAWHFR